MLISEDTSEGVGGETEKETVRYNNEQVPAVGNWASVLMGTSGTL